jgi:TRAP-type C4-dicarboxylate transport system permease small subunit
MMRKTTSLTVIATLVTLGVPFVLTQSVFAQAAGVSQVQGFIRSIIQVIAGLAGLVATGFFVVGGFGYITSSGNPEHLDRSKRTLLYSAIGLAITIAAFVISNIVTEIATNAFGK